MKDFIWGILSGVCFGVAIALALVQLFPRPQPQFPRSYPIAACPTGTGYVNKYGIIICDSSGFTPALGVSPLDDQGIQNLDTINHRLDSLDGGKTKNWYCDTNMVSVHVCPYTIISTSPQEQDAYNTACQKEAQASFKANPPPKEIIHTIGAETPGQLGYQDCTQLP